MTAAEFEVYSSGHPRRPWRWRFATGVGEERIVLAASGEGFATKAEALERIDAVKREAPTATIGDEG